MSEEEFSHLQKLQVKDIVTEAIKNEMQEFRLFITGSFLPVSRYEKEQVTTRALLIVTLILAGTAKYLGLI